MALIVLLIVLAVLAYYFLGAPLLEFIHRFVKEFTQTFPLWVFFRGLPGARIDIAGARNRRARQKRPRRSGGAPQF